MFNFNSLESIHLEITNNCQASCPMCNRNVHGGLKNPLIKISEWSLEDFKLIMNEEVLNQIKGFFFCGNFGDPILNNNLIEMCEYASGVNPDLSIRIHTNGSLRNKDWWIRLKEALPKNHAVIFALDGLKDTNHLYRVGTDFDKIIENAKTFISVGGNAEWAFIRFKHNEHQVEEAKSIAKKLGFSKFEMKESSRFLVEPKYDVVDKNGNITHVIHPSTASELSYITVDMIKNYKKIVNSVDIECYAINQKEVYIDAHKQLFPCCWISSIPYTYIDNVDAVSTVRNDIKKEYDILLNEFGGVENLDTKKKSIKEIVNSKNYQTIWFEFWKNKMLTMCARSCGKTKLYSTPQDQFLKTENLKDEIFEKL